MISPVIEWDHSEDYFVPKFSGDWFEQRNIAINISDKEFEYIQGHVIDGNLRSFRNLSASDPGDFFFRQDSFSWHGHFGPGLADICF